MEKINKEWLFQKTGDAFADTGAWTLECFTKMHPEDSILQLIERVAKIYIYQWEAKINPFFLNSTITQPAFVGDRKLEETMRYFTGIIQETEDSKEGNCRILGHRTRLYSAGRDNHMMSGSGKFINFHHGFEGGLMLSKEIIIRMFFVPFGAVFIGNKVAVFSSNSLSIEKWFVHNIVETENFKRIATQSSTGVYKSPYGNPANTLFESIRNWSSLSGANEEEGVEITLFHFTNFGASPEIDIYSFGANLFKFYRKMLHRNFKNDWLRLVRNHYKPPKGNVYNETEDQFYTEEKKERKPLASGEELCFYNLIYDRLLNGRNILPLITSWARRQYDQQTPFRVFHIAKSYKINLHDMKEETLKKIEQIAEIVVSNADKRKKWINSLVRIKNDATFRSFLIQLIQENYKNDTSEPVIRLREYEQFFLSDGIWAAESRDLILIAVYEKLCDAKIMEEIEVPEENNEQ